RSSIVLRAPTAENGLLSLRPRSFSGCSAGRFGEAMLGPPSWVPAASGLTYGFCEAPEAGEIVCTLALPAFGCCFGFCARLGAAPAATIAATARMDMTRFMSRLPTGVAGH